MKIAQKRASIRKLNNIIWVRDWIQKIPQLGLGKFDFIECSGVLHHLKNPEAGFRAVVANVRPGGHLHCWVYAKEGNGLVILLVVLRRSCV
jgi:2-polyprenyl-3-methyl-5-hydroxy-6-metoxy-1,4-benzoquinol methylase